MASPEPNTASSTEGTAHRVAIRSVNGVATERITRALAEAGWRHTAAVDEETSVVVTVHRRAGSSTCADVRELAGASARPVIVVVVGQAGSGDVRRTLQAGALAVVAEGSIETALVPSIKAAIAGQIVIPARVGVAGTPRLLTTREKQILGLMVMGLNNSAIATKLFLAESTVKSHLSSAFAKLGVSSRNEAASVILDPNSGTGLGILTIQSE